MSDKQYWTDFYLRGHTLEPTDFAVFMVKFLKQYNSKGKTVIDLGCGNGRDTYYFKKMGLQPIGIDQVTPNDSSMQFVCKDFTKLQPYKKIDFMYSRFSLHSIKLSAENRVHRFTKNSLRPGGLYFIEVRSTKDELFGKGIKLSDREYEFTHYRRFIEFSELKARLLDNKFSIVYAIEEQGLAKYEKEDATIIRIVAIK